MSTNENNHTPGPWDAGRPDMATIVDGYEAKWIYSADGEYIAVSTSYTGKKKRRSWGKVVANAHLAAAAPELLDVASYLDAIQVDAGEGDVPDFHNYPFNARWVKLVDIARAALAKARGETEGNP